jgi:hypothetical protein
MANTSGAKQQEKSTLQNVADKAKGVAAAVGDKADSAVSAVGSGVQSVGETIREKGPQSGILGKATSGLASALETSGHYLEEQGLSGMADDVTSMIRRNPIPAVLIGIGIGFLLARATRS